MFTMGQKWFECGEFIKEMRSKQKITQADLAKKIDISTSLISRIEKGERRPTQRTLLLLSNVFGVTIQVLQQKSGYTPEFDWYASFLTQPEQKEPQEDILPTATDSEKEKLREYLRYLRFRDMVLKTKKPNINKYIDISI